MASAAPELVLITAGGQNVLSTAVRTITAPGSPVPLEASTYHGPIRGSVWLR